MERKDQALATREEEEVARIYSAADWGSGAAPRGGPTKNFAGGDKEAGPVFYFVRVPAAASPPNLPGPLAGLPRTGHGPFTRTLTRFGDLAAAGSH